ncbi:MAG: hypothetical protein P4L85_25125 [Paludisphaera borealis]|uniref:hypothetical protein n=1 Tax=Paludisphaera borealis TaxID=1387353 RepID=UPI0028412EA6|nr:hypothetical protein [Paludisphaera borealis]MDR3622659.1 hypothetical protein [Paludisphaera borealis]
MSDVDDIRQQMAQIRHDMHYNVSNVVSEVEDAMDWRSNIRKHPYIALGVGLAVGYFVVPRRRRRVERTVTNIQPLLEASMTPEYAARPEKPPKSLGRKATGWALGLVWPLVSQSVQAYAAVWLETQLKQHLNLNPHPSPHGDDGPSSSAGNPGESYGGDAVYRMPKRG